MAYFCDGLLPRSQLMVLACAQSCPRFRSPSPGSRSILHPPIASMACQEGPR
ncbi:sugar transporter [Cryptococcus neoformans]|nr:sugar transporter [Cryptococcus neoformans var. grubii]OXC58101.1 hypothetical protein C358_06465 [Cryptococcus neoformans var. grubii MW-RSA852]